jgi:hypothetical protein
MELAALMGYRLTLNEHPHQESRMPTESSRHSDSANHLTGHRGQVMQEMKVNSLAELVRMAVKIQSGHQAIYSP